MKSDRKENAQFVHIGDVIEKVLSGCRYERDDQLSNIWDAWAKAVGPDISKNAKPAAIRGATLVVNVSGSSWLHQLRFLKEDMIGKINQSIGKDAVRELKFKVGPV